MKQFLKENEMRVQAALSDSGQGPLAVSYEHSNESFDSMKRGIYKSRSGNKFTV
jgi:hypothetical protein